LSGIFVPIIIEIWYLVFQVTVENVGDVFETQYIIRFIPQFWSSSDRRKVQPPS